MRLNITSNVPRRAKKAIVTPIRIWEVGEEGRVDKNRNDAVDLAMTKSPILSLSETRLTLHTEEGAVAAYSTEEKRTLQSQLIDSAASPTLKPKAF